MNAPGDAGARRRIRSELETTFVVEAAAGTGKTTELVNRIVEALESGAAQVEGIAAVTFTEKAAGELKLRLRAELDVRGTRADLAPDRRARVAQALARLEEAQVGTIHGLCAELLRERTVEARVDPRFATMQEPESRALFARTFRGWLEERLADPPEGLARVLRRRTTWNETPSGKLLDAAWSLNEWADFSTAWRRPEMDRLRHAASLLEKLARFCALRERAASRRDPLWTPTAGAAAALDVVARRVSATAHAARRGKGDAGAAVPPLSAPDLDWVEAVLVGLSRDWSLKKPDRGRGTTYGPGLSRLEVVAAKDELVGALEAFARNADADLAALLAMDLAETIPRYEEAKRRIGKLSFLDLLVRTRDLLAGSDAARRHFQARFTHLYVDEFQDTDPLQADIVLLLAAGDAGVRDPWSAVPRPGKLFIVGDPKQSIYRFRRADVGTYHRMQRHLGGLGASSLVLATSYRAPSPIQRCVNRAFGELMVADARTHQAGYVPLEPHRPDHPDQPSVVALPVPRPYGSRGSVTKEAIDASLPAAVAAFVEWLVEKSGYTVTDRRSEGRTPIEPRHVCILFRRFEGPRDDLTLPFVEALDAREIPHVLVGGRSYHRREEVGNLRAVLEAIEWPDEELMVFATCKGPFLALDDELLLDYRRRYGRLDPFAERDEALPERLAPVGDALDLLASLHVQRNLRPVADTIELFLEATRAYASLAFRPNGERVLANVMQVVHLARAHEEAGGISFRGFVKELLQGEEEGIAPEAPLMEEDSDGVRIMTVHKAKGLEFPVVILADMTTARRHDWVTRHVDPDARLAALRLAGLVPLDLAEHLEDEMDREEAEAVRVAYVAATRARDMLVIPAIGSTPFASGWLSPFNAAIYPEDPGRAEPAPGCPPFGPSSVLEGPEGGPFDGRSVRPGLHRFEGYDVVWWDPAVLDLARRPTFGVRQETLLSPRGVTDEVVAADRARHEAWRARRERILETGAAPTLTVRIATDPEAQAEAGLRSVAVLDVAAGGAPRRSRPSGIRFGSLVHAVLAGIPLDAPEASVLAEASLQARLLGATLDEVHAAAAAVVAALRHPLLARARRAWEAGSCRRECPLTLRPAPGSLVEGVVDLAFEEDGRYVVVDFKTDMPADELLDRYRRQVSLYAEAVARATGLPVDAALLRV